MPLWKNVVDDVFPCFDLFDAHPCIVSLLGNAFSITMLRGKDVDSCRSPASPRQGPRLDLSWLPPVYVLTAHLSIDEQDEAESCLSNAGAPVTYDLTEARVILGNLAKARRARLELQWRGIDIEVDQTANFEQNKHVGPQSKSKHIAGRKGRHKHQEYSTGESTSDSDQTSSDSTRDDSTGERTGRQSFSSSGPPSHIATSSEAQSKASNMRLVSQGQHNGILVLSLDWLQECSRNATIAPMKPHVLIQGIVHVKNSTAQLKREDSSSLKNWSGEMLPATHSEKKASGDESASILARAKADASSSSTTRQRKQDRTREAAMRDIKGKGFASSTQNTSSVARIARSRPHALLRQTTSENEEALDIKLPPPPDWVLQGKIYSCERLTPLETPNDDFIDQLKQIREARQLILDEIGVRAYSTSIASLSAYPYRLQSSCEVLALPGCDQKIAALFSEYKQNDGHLKGVEEIQSDPALKVLKEFFNIWGVGATTARDFYYDKGWQDLDDIIEFGWNMLSRVQQIGLKYYDDFLKPIPRTEVESIAFIITAHAARLTDSRIQCAIVGGYRRGKTESGDVDVILSHPDETQTLHIIEKMVESLEKENWITHTLILNSTTSRRNQEPLPINSMAGHGGFDSLDKALIVWQDPSWPTKDEDLATNDNMNTPSANPPPSNKSKAKLKNPNPHRRVDIIISPWRTVGCAVAGWTSGTTFQRDLRRYCKYVRGWKFDSSGVRERGSGRWVDLEGWRDPQTRCQTWQEAEKRVFKGLRLEYREPWERCTG